MAKQIAFLRGINVSGQKKIPMAELRGLLTKNGYKGVKTYTQSGNIVFDSDNVPVNIVRSSLEDIIRSHFDFDVPVLVKSLSELRKILRANPFCKKEDLESNRIYFVMLFKHPEKEKVDLFKKEEYPKEKWELLGDCLYLCCENGYGNAKLNNNLVESKLKVDATTRNYRTIMKLLEMGSSN